MSESSALSSQIAPVAGDTAWVFAGQGSQVSGMGRDIYEEFCQTRALFESQAAGFDLKELCFTAPAEKLGDTRYTQASMAVFAAAVIRVLRDNNKDCGAAFGLSLGEYCALHAAGVFDVETLLSLLGFRGAIMAEASALPSRMTAIIGLSDSEVESAVTYIANMTGKIVSCTNYNCPGQVAIGGEQEAVEAAEQLLKKSGARRCLPLKTSGPFHTPLMDTCAELLATRLTDTPLHPQRVPVIFNATAAPAPDTMIRTLLARQIASPVRFTQSVRALEAAGIRSVIEIGPGRTLAGLIKKTAPDIKVVSIETAQDLKEVIAS